MTCPKCKSDKVVKAGKVIRAGGMRQRYQCKSCGHPWVEDRKEAVDKMYFPDVKSAV